ARCGAAVSRAERYAEALEIAAQSLLALDRLEQRLEVALAEGARTVPLDHLEEERRPVLRRLREDLEEVPVLVAVDEDAQPTQVGPRLLDVADTVERVLVVRLRRGQEADAARLHLLDRPDDVVGLDRDVLDPRAAVVLEVLGDLALAAPLGRLVDRELDLPLAVRHHL